jgi:hypothetical protein
MSGVSFEEVPDYTGIAAAPFIPDDNAGRYAHYSRTLNRSDTWHRGTAYPHPDYDTGALCEAAVRRQLQRQARSLDGDCAFDREVVSRIHGPAIGLEVPVLVAPDDREASVNRDASDDGWIVHQRQRRCSRHPSQGDRGIGLTSVK